MKCLGCGGMTSFSVGKSFGNAFKIDEQMTCPCRDIENQPSDDCRFLNGGDTQGLTAIPDGSFVLVFPSDIGTKMEFFLAKI